MIDSDDSFGEGWNQADLDETNPAHESLRKITFAPDITVQGRAISFKQLEEVVFEGKVSYTDGVYYFNCPKLKRSRSRRVTGSRTWESMPST